MTILKKKPTLFQNRKVQMLPTAKISPNPHQPRTIFNQKELSALSASIEEYGVLQPISVRKLDSGLYELVAGERRLRASRMAGLSEIPCLLIETTEKESSLLALVENIQRQNLGFFEEAEGIRRLMLQFGLSQDEVARRLGRSQSAVANKLRLLKHSPAVTEAIRQHDLTERHARALLRLQTEEDKLLAIETIATEQWNVAQSDLYIDLFYETKPDDVTDPLPEPQKGLSVEKLKERGKQIHIFRDTRLFLNTINRAIDSVRLAGVAAKIRKEEQNGEISLWITIPRVG